jgi:hypothetical protein
MRLEDLAVAVRPAIDVAAQCGRRSIRRSAGARTGFAGRNTNERRTSLTVAVTATRRTAGGRWTRRGCDSGWGAVAASFYS